VVSQQLLKKRFLLNDKLEMTECQRDEGVFKGRTRVEKFLLTPLYARRIDDSHDEPSEVNISSEIANFKKSCRYCSTIQT